MRPEAVQAVRRHLRATVCIVDKVGKGDERVVERLPWGDAPLLVKSQHALEQVDELSPIHFLRHQFTSFQVRWHVDLLHTVTCVTC